jgi:hypothetical protein
MIALQAEWERRAGEATAMGGRAFERLLSLVEVRISGDPGQHFRPISGNVSADAGQHFKASRAGFQTHLGQRFKLISGNVP